MASFEIGDGSLKVLYELLDGYKHDKAALDDYVNLDNSDDFSLREFDALKSECFVSACSVIDHLLWCLKMEE